MSYLGIYIHIPFCLSKCPYCSFNSYVANPVPEDIYIKILLLEIRLIYVERFSDYRMVDSIYFGGGTPSF